MIHESSQSFSHSYSKQMMKGFHREFQPKTLLHWNLCSYLEKAWLVILQRTFIFPWEFNFSSLTVRLYFQSSSDTKKVEPKRILQRNDLYLRAKTLGWGNEVKYSNTAKVKDSLSFTCTKNYSLLPSTSPHKDFFHSPQTKFQISETQRLSLLPLKDLPLRTCPLCMVEGCYSFERFVNTSVLWHLRQNLWHLSKGSRGDRFLTCYLSVR